MAKNVSKSPKIGYFIQSRGPGGKVEFEEVYIYGPTRRSDEGLVGHDLRMRPARLGPGDYTFVGSPDDVEWTRPTSSQAKKSSAQIKREIDEVLAGKPGKNLQVSSTPATGSRPWQGTDSNERLINSVHNALVAVYLDGVVGVSPVIGEYGWKQIQPDKADAYIRKGKEALDKLVSQKAPASVKGWLAHKVSALRDLLEKAQAVRDGVTHQKMTMESYAELRRSLNLR